MGEPANKSIPAKSGPPLVLRPYRDSDGAGMAELIAHTLKISNKNDYSPEYLERIARSHSPAFFAERAKDVHFYVVCDGDRIVGCGGITAFDGSPAESYILSVFTHPEYQGIGIGKQIMEALETDAYFRRARRTELDASVTAVGFYQKTGYTFVHGVTGPDENGVIRMEKYNRPGEGPENDKSAEEKRRETMERIFESEHISFVRVNEGLIPDYLVMVNDYEHVNRFIGGKQRTYTAEQEAEWVRGKLAEQAQVFSMIGKTTGEYIGNIELMDVTGTEGELGIAITAAKQDLGYGTEAILALLGYGFDRLGLRRIFLRTKPTNARAIHVYKKCGFREYHRDETHVYMETIRQNEG